MLVNVVDVPSLCNFILPAIVRTGPLAIAISTAGASPALAKRMKREISELLRRGLRRARRDPQRRARLGEGDPAHLPGPQGLLRGDRQRRSRPDRAAPGRSPGRARRGHRRRARAPRQPRRDDGLTTAGGGGTAVAPQRGEAATPATPIRHIRALIRASEPITVLAWPANCGRRGRRDHRSAARRVAEICGRQFGVIARPQLLAAGFSPTRVRDWVRSGRLHRVHPGVYALGRPELSVEGEMAAALLYSGRGSALGGISALWWLGLLNRRPALIHIDAPGRGGSRADIRIRHPREHRQGSGPRHSRRPPSRRHPRLGVRARAPTRCASSSPAPSTSGCSTSGS